MGRKKNRNAKATPKKSSETVAKDATAQGDGTRNAADVLQSEGGEDTAHELPGERTTLTQPNADKDDKILPDELCRINADTGFPEWCRLHCHCGSSFVSHAERERARFKECSALARSAPFTQNANDSQTFSQFLEKYLPPVSEPAEDNGPPLSKSALLSDSLLADSDVCVVGRRPGTPFPFDIQPSKHERCDVSERQGANKETTVANTKIEISTDNGAEVGSNSSLKLATAVASVAGIASEDGPRKLSHLEDFQEPLRGQRETKWLDILREIVDSEVALVKSENEKLRETTGRLMREKEELVGASEVSERKLAISKEALKKLQQMLKEANAEKTELSNRIAELGERMEVYEEEAADSKDDLDSAYEELEQLQRELDSEESTRRAASARAEKLKASVSALTLENKDLSSKVRAQNKRHTRLQQELSAAKASKAEESARLKRENEALKQRSAELSAQLNETKKDLSASARRIRALAADKELAEANAKPRMADMELEGIIAKLLSENEQLRKQVNSTASSSHSDSGQSTPNVSAMTKAAATPAISTDKSCTKDDRTKKKQAFKQLVENVRVEIQEDGIFKTEKEIIEEFKALSKVKSVAGMNAQDVHRLLTSHLTQKLPASEPSPADSSGCAKIFGDDDCSICIDGLGNGQPLTVNAACGHIHHLQCMAKWQQTKPSCPKCYAIAKP